MFLLKILRTATAGLTLLASVTIAVKAETRLGYSMRKDQTRGLQSNVCLPQPIRVLNNGTNPIFAEEIYLIVHLAEPSNRTNFVDVVALDATAGPAYGSSVNCSLSFGSVRSLTNCTTVTENVIFERDAVLMKCAEYASNSIDGSTVFGATDLYTDATCDCACGDPPGAPFPAFVAPDGTCPCSCTGSRGKCVCYAPSKNDYVDTLNDLYKATSDFLGKNVSVVNVTDANVFRNCGFPNITYDANSVCLPGSPPSNPISVASSSVAPTKRPTRHPTKKPTHKPTRKPTKKPTKKPTRHPTMHPTNHPTMSPTTSPPTKAPTHMPTATPTIPPASKPLCDYLCTEDPNWTTACAEFTNAGLCPTLNSVNTTFTVFVSRNAGFTRLRTANDFTNNEWANKFQDIMEFQIIVGTAISLDKLCSTSPLVTLQGESLTVDCQLVDVTATTLFTELVTKRIVTGQCNAAENTAPEILRLFGAKNGYVIETDDLALTNSFENCVVPTGVPTRAPTASPTPSPTMSVVPTSSPTASPTISPEPTIAPSASPTSSPSSSPSTLSNSPSSSPVASPSSSPSSMPTLTLSSLPSSSPSSMPTPTLSSPPSSLSNSPSISPVASPSSSPVASPSSSPVASPSSSPSSMPSPALSDSPTDPPSSSPTDPPSSSPSSMPSPALSDSPTDPPSSSPSSMPTPAPSDSPTDPPSSSPSSMPSPALSAPPTDPPII